MSKTPSPTRDVPTSGDAKVEFDLGLRETCTYADSVQLGQPLLPRDYEDADVEETTEDFGQIANLLQTLSSISASARKLKTLRRQKAQWPLVLPDIPEKISLEEWSVKACYIEDIVYPSSRNCSYLTSSLTNAFTDTFQRTLGSKSSLFLSSYTESSSAGSFSADTSRWLPRDAHEKNPSVRLPPIPHGTGLQCRRNENPDILVLLGGTKFPCHRTVLSLHSQYFHAIIRDNPGIQKVDLQGVPKDAFHILLDYMYTGKLNLTCQNVGKLYVTASILKVARVKKKCAKILTKSPYDPKYALYVYVTARKYGLVSVCKRALKLLHHRFEETITCKPFLDLDMYQVCEVLSGNSVGARGEMVVFLAALHWLNHNYLENEAYVLKLIQCVRFTTMNLEELLSCLHPPVLPGIMDIPEVRAHIQEAICFKISATFGQQNLFSDCVKQPRYFKLDGPIGLWDLNIFSREKNISNAPKSSKYLKFVNSTNSNAFRRQPTGMGERSLLLMSDPLSCYLLRSKKDGRFEVPASCDQPYKKLPLVKGTPWDQEIPVLLAIGGYNPDSPSETAVGTKILRYHVRNNSWELLDSFPMPRHHHCAVLHKEKLYITGGYDNYQTCNGRLLPTNMCFTFDLAKRAWQPLPNMNHCRAYHGSVIVDNTLYVIGGRGADGRILASVEMHTIESKHWQELPARLCRPRMAAGSVVHQEQVWVAGGLTESDAGLVVIADVDCFDPRTHE